MECFFYIGGLKSDSFRKLGIMNSDRLGDPLTQAVYFLFLWTTSRIYFTHPSKRSPRADFEGRLDRKNCQTQHTSTQLRFHRNRQLVVREARTLGRSQLRTRIHTQGAADHRALSPDPGGRQACS